MVDHYHYNGDHIYIYSKVLECFLNDVSSAHNAQIMDMSLFLLY